MYIRSRSIDSFHTMVPARPSEKNLNPLRIFLPKIKYDRLICWRIIFGNWHINEYQTPSRPTWPRPRVPVVKGSLGASLLSRIFLHRKSGIPISRLYLTPMYLFIFDILTYFREFFLLLCWHNARC